MSRKLGLVLLVALAVPCAFAAEVAARRFLLPAGFHRVRIELGPALTRAAWGLFLLSLPAGVIGIALHRSLVRRGLARTPDERLRVETGALLLAGSIPQIPAILATVASLLGALALPVLATLSTSTAAILIQAAWPLPRNAR